MANTWILTAVGKDRPGIVARVTKMLFGLGCNLENSTMTRLGGEFAIMLAFSSSKPLTSRRIEKACEPLSNALKLAVHLKPLAKPAAGHAEGGKQLYFISVYGADRPGIVYRVSQLLADLQVNITDVSTHRTPPAPGRAKPLYLMLLEVELPPRVGGEQLEARLRKLGGQLGCEVSLRSAEAQVF